MTDALLLPIVLGTVVLALAVDLVTVVGWLLEKSREGPKS
jgi:ABC-type transport system involved in cytochrome bd biosynthesis fused ATPase/permease subunit